MPSSPANVAVLGGGQLGLMLGQAGLPLGITCRFLDPAADAPACVVGDLVVGALDDPDALAAVAVGADVATYEWEGVPAASADLIAADGVPVRPGSRSLAVSQDRLVEKSTCRELGIATPVFAAVDDRPALEAAVAALGTPAVVKTRRGGYDGKGQFVVRTPSDVDAAWEALGGAPLILEAFVPFSRELSVLAVRGLDGTTSCWPVVENHHVDGILRLSIAPAPDLGAALQARAEEIATTLLDALDHVGVLAVELFELDGGLLVNELAPRVHNSGHWTIEGAVTSQFENHLRAILGRPLGSTAPRDASAMVNCIGSMPDADAVLAVPGAHLHDYGKAARPGRKVGHITVTALDATTLAERVARVRALVD